jgi:hypothetical protein
MKQSDPLVKNLRALEAFDDLNPEPADSESELERLRAMLPASILGHYDFRRRRGQPQPCCRDQWRMRSLPDRCAKSFDAPITTIRCSRHVPGVQRLSFFQGTVRTGNGRIGAPQEDRVTKSETSYSLCRHRTGNITRFDV